MSSGSINDLQISRTLTGSLAGGVSRFHQLSASYFSMSSGSINNLSGNIMNLSGVSRISPVVGKVLFQNFSTTFSTITNIPLLSQSIAAGETWHFNYILPTVLTGTGGFRYTIFTPTGSLLEGFINGCTTTPDTLSKIRLFDINTEIASTFNNASLIVMPQNLNFTIRNANIAGNVTVGIRRVTATDFSHIISGSSMIATKIT